ncbi:hypothetical protein FRX31_013213, partial [Thalictrum thalictroides]
MAGEMTSDQGSSPKSPTNTSEPLIPNPLATNPSSSPPLASTPPMVFEKETLCKDTTNLFVGSQGDVRTDDPQANQTEEAMLNKKSQRWNSLLKDPPPSAGKEELNFMEPNFVEGLLVIEEDIWEEGEKDWEDRIVGFFLDKKLPFSMVKEHCSKKWNLKGEMEVALDGDMFYFKFNNEQDRIDVLEEGSIYKLASTIGKPICMDKATEAKQMLTYARLCVEISADKKLPDEIKLKGQRGKTFIVDLEYPWKPLMCSQCKIFGHTLQNCEKKGSTQQAKKQPTKQKDLEEGEWKPARCVWRKKGKFDNEAGPSDVRTNTTNVERALVIHSDVNNVVNPTTPAKLHKSAHKEMSTMQILETTSNMFECLHEEEEAIRDNILSGNKVLNITNEDIQSSWDSSDREDEYSYDDSDKEGLEEGTLYEINNKHTFRTPEPAKQQVKGKNMAREHSVTRVQTRSKKANTEAKAKQKADEEGMGKNRGIRGIVETKVKARNSAMLQSRINDWGGVNNNSKDPRGRIWVMWDTKYLKVHTLGMTDQDFKELVKVTWNCDVSGNPMMRLCTKLKLLKGKLKEWSENNFSDLKGRVTKARESLDRIQNAIQTNPLDLNLAAMEKAAIKEYNDIAAAEESSAKQKAGAKWANLGDDNTGFFHKVVQGNRARNSIHSVMDQHQNCLTDKHEIAEEFVKHYKTMLGTSVSTTDNNSWQHLEVERKVPEADKASMIAA